MTPNQTTIKKNHLEELLSSLDSTQSINPPIKQILEEKSNNESGDGHDSSVRDGGDHDSVNHDATGG
jgi:hypothetical protein